MKRSRGDWFYSYFRKVTKKPTSGDNTPAPTSSRNSSIHYHNFISLSLQYTSHHSSLNDMMIWFPNPHSPPHHHPTEHCPGPNQDATADVEVPHSGTINPSYPHIIIIIMSSLYTSHHASSSLYHNITIWFPILLNIIILDIIVQAQMLQAMLRSLIQAHHHYHIHLIYIMISSPSSSLSSHQHDDLQRKWVATTKTTKLRTRRTLRILMAKVPTWTGCRCCRCCYRCFIVVVVVVVVVVVFDAENTDAIIDKKKHY